MLSKFVRPCVGGALQTARGSLGVLRGPLRVPRRFSGDYIPPDQYDLPFPKRLKLTYALVKYWEIIPVVGVTAIALSFVVMATFWAIGHKVDVVYSTHNYNTIERTMDLRNPSTNKMRVINQRYEPWPEMQTVLDKMTMAEKRNLVRLETCKQI